MEDSYVERTITVSAVILHDRAGRWLTVRKRGTSCFMHPGGKPEPGENARDAALREVSEELRLELDPAELEHLGPVHTTAANEPGFRLYAEVFIAPCDVEPRPAAEIDDARWIDPRDLLGAEKPDPELAPLLYDCVRMWPARVR